MRKPLPPRVTPISITIRCGALQRRLRDVSQLHLRATRPPPFDHYDEAHRADVGDCPLSGVKRTSNAQIEFFPPFAERATIFRPGEAARPNPTRRRGQAVVAGDTVTRDQGKAEELSACGRALRPWLWRTLLPAAVLDPSGQASPAEQQPCRTAGARFTAARVLGRGRQRA